MNPSVFFLKYNVVSPLKSILQNLGGDFLQKLPYPPCGIVNNPQCTVPPSQRFEMQIPFSLAPLKQCVHVHVVIFRRFSDLAILLGHFPAFDLG